MIVPRSWLRGVGVALDRAANALLDGDADLTMSQTVGLALLSIPRPWWARPVAAVLNIITGELHHAVRALYTDDGTPIFPDRMPPGAPARNPYP